MKGLVSRGAAGPLQRKGVSETKQAKKRNEKEMKREQIKIIGGEPALKCNEIVLTTFWIKGVSKHCI